MAQVDIGKIKIVWKGPWNSGTAYTVDDAVSHSGSSYICIQAGTNQNPSSATAYWQQMASKGTDADLINIASTAQGDIYYNNGSAIARLGAGTSGQFLKTQGTSANPTWGTVSTEKAIKQVVFSQTSTRFSTTSTSYVATPITMAITPTSTSSKIIIWCRMNHATLSDGYPRYKWHRAISGGSSGFINTEPTNSNGGASLGAYLNMRHSSESSNTYETQQVTDFFQDTTHNTTSAITYTLYGVCENGGTLFVNTSNHNEGGNGSDYNQVGTSNMMAWEMTV